MYCFKCGGTDDLHELHSHAGLAVCGACAAACRDAWRSSLKPKRRDAAMGWICPRCGKIYAPILTECYKCNSATKRFCGEEPKNVII
jgi:hypothetical protein